MDQISDSGDNGDNGERIDTESPTATTSATIAGAASGERTDPIVAIATAPGQGGIGVVRVSGRNLGALIVGLCGSIPAPRRATYTAFEAADGSVIDRGIALFFGAPHSYTGEDVLELQGHGGPVVLRMLVERCLELGAAIGLRLAEPGEFTRRAFLNDKLDLAQAEAVADLISARTAAAARSAQASLSGAFSNQVRELVDAAIRLRMLVEATLDFPEEEIDFLQQSDARGQLAQLRKRLAALLEQSRQGALLRDGIKVVLAGRPNVGKSSLLNALAGAEVAIVTPIAGTTRDKITETIQIDGVPIHIVDTAGIRELRAAAVAEGTRGDAAHRGSDPHQIERIGIVRTWAEIRAADVILNLRDASEPDTAEDRAIAEQLDTLVAGDSAGTVAAPWRIVYNKLDLTGEAARVDADRIYLSAKSGAGIDLLRRELLSIAGWRADDETVFLARERHLRALRAAQRHLTSAADHADEGDRQLDLFAEELRLAQGDLNAITGEFTSDDLLGEIFSRFCIGK